MLYFFSSLRHVRSVMAKIFATFASLFNKTHTHSHAHKRLILINCRKKWKWTSVKRAVGKQSRFKQIFYIIHKPNNIAEEMCLVEFMLSRELHSGNCQFNYWQMLDQLWNGAAFYTAPSIIFLGKRWTRIFHVIRREKLKPKLGRGYSPYHMNRSCEFVLILCKSFSKEIYVILNSWKIYCFSALEPN